MGEACNLEENLRSETLKWLDRAQVLFFTLSSEGDEGFIENISAYLSDSRHFLDSGDLIRAFEAVVWAWAWMEIGLEKGFLKAGKKDEEPDKKGAGPTSA